MTTTLPSKTSASRTKSSPAKQRACGYIRVSTARDEMLSPDIQTNDVNEYAKRRGLTLGRIYSDLDNSGREGAKARPAFEEMLRDAEAGAFDVLVVPKLSRFGRSARQNLLNFDRLERANVAMVFMDLDMDTSKGFGKMMRTFLSALAEWESDVRADYWRETWKHLIGSGAAHPMAPYAYRYDSTAKSYTVVEDEAWVVRDVFDRFNRGESITLIVRAHPSLTRTVVNGIVDNRVYSGFRELHGEVFKGNWEPLIDPETFEAARLRREVQRANGTSSGGRGRGLTPLSGLLVCGVCGGVMSRTGDAYSCANRKPMGTCKGGTIRTSKVERVVSEQFFDRVEAAYSATSYPEDAVRRHIDTPNGERPLSDQLSAVNQRIDKVVALMLDGPGEGFTAAYRKQAAKLEEERERLTTAIAAEGINRADDERRAAALDALVAKAKDLRQVYALADGPDQNAMLSLVIKEVGVTPVANTTGHGSRKHVDIAWR